MRIALPLACLLFATTAAADTPRPNARGFELPPSPQLPSFTPPSVIVPDMTLPGKPQPANCRARIEAVREERGLPKLERRSASPDEPLLFYAVEKQIDGCSVLLMHNTGEIRPVPEHDGIGRMMPAK